MLQVEVITLFPEMVNTVTEYGITGRAAERGLLKVNTWNPRDYASDNHRTVDDRPFGGGPGMVMMAAPLCAAIKEARSVGKAEGVEGKAHVIHLSPQGRKLDQKGVMELAQRQHLILIAGRYEGIDERVIDKEVDEEWSIGDYVLSGGELAAMVLIDVLTRTLPGALGHEDSAKEDSFFDGLLDYPHYTRPEKLELDQSGDYLAGKSQQVPDVLLSGNHEEIRRWRLQQALGRTWLRRSDLLENLQLNAEQQDLLEAFKKEHLK
ncbi:MAG: tRNA (guanine37-N1)-methyltransferase [Gammaproteobacteria bacterium]|jgi:tRNA (guanine37-N1)-methyltransferase